MKPFNPEQALLSTRREFGEHGGVTPSISRSSTFMVMEPGTMADIFTGKKGPDQGGYFLYGRHCNPTVAALSRYLAAMEDCQAALCTASGMAAIACALMQLCQKGDHIVASDCIYGGSHALMESLFPQMGITTTFVNIADTGAVEGAITPKTRVIYTEAMGNPILRIADLPTLSKLAHPRNIKLVVDNTFSPLVFSPKRLGADVVIYAMTKYINGASDLIAGAVCGDEAFIQEMMDLNTGRAMLIGPTMDPRAAFDIIQRLPHLPMRMKEHGQRGQAMAQMLSDMGLSVIYPGLDSHPQHELAIQMGNPGYGMGGIIALDCGTRERAEALMDLLQNQEEFGFMAVSLGYFDTLISCSGSSTSSEIDEVDQKKMGLSPGLLRISLGYTGDMDARMEQMRRGVEKVGLK